MLCTLACSTAFPLSGPSPRNRTSESFEILMSVCLQKDTNLCSDVEKLDFCQFPVVERQTRQTKNLFCNEETIYHLFGVLLVISKKIYSE